MQLYEALSIRIAAWREENYKHETYPAIAEILEWAANPEFPNFRLRQPQLRALETYWYLRLVENTPHIFDLYQSLFPKKKNLLEAFGIPDEAFSRADYDLEALIESIRDDPDFVREFRLEAVRETLTLDYPSYILALAMGAGKTILIGAIFATEFAMAQEYPEDGFVENALVFAPGKTIIESLRELAETHYEAILPPRMYKSFAATLKLTFTRDGDPDIPVTRGSSWNVIVTNTEKIRIQKETINKSYLGPLFDQKKEDEAKAEVANLRLQAIASLPKLAIFSDEAHHTYGQAMDRELKKVRKTVNYLHNPHVESGAREAHETQLVCVVNTTGTPFFQRQPLRDVVVWYGLSEGIRDGILKEVAGNIYGIDFRGNEKEYLAFVVEDFFQTYGAVELADGTPAKLAIFFPQTDDVSELRPIVETTLTKIGLPPALILEHHTKNENKADFDRFKSKDSPQRVALLVDRGVEGWNVPALFACALARQLKTSNNFVLQAASRCLRQVAGNEAKARIYLSLENKNVLDRQLQETYGETFAALLGGESRSRSTIITLRKVDNVPPLVVQKVVRSLRRVEAKRASPLQLTRPTIGADKGTVIAYTPGEGGKLQVADQVTTLYDVDTFDLYTTAQDLRRTYRLEVFELLSELQRLYPEGSLPVSHYVELAKQVEKHTSQYEVIEETVEVALALVKKEGFKQETDEQGNETYTAEISYPIDREHLLAHYADWQKRAGKFGFHYTPYNFDSNPEQNFFENLLELLKLKPDEVEDIYFTGALTDTKKTDFYIEYRGNDGRMHNYTPDFIIRRNDGKCLIVEVKREKEREDEIDGENGAKALATRKWEGLNPDRLKYQMVFTPGESIASKDMIQVQSFMRRQEKRHGS
ncbi:MAG: DEAD/DEAH box helicase family protein [Anaerolineales bacterium]|nr:DEAD/DEAH box helicase family protein [Anaerolineales bacterium]